jgi:hypothetical protein
MSSIPSEDWMIVSELIAWSWSDRQEMETRGRAIKAALENNPEIAEFLSDMRREYYDTDKGYGPESWRDFRNFVVHDYFHRRFDGEAFREECVNNYERA